MEEPQGRNAGPALPFQAPFSSVGPSGGFSLLEMMAVIDLILVLRRRPRRAYADLIPIVAEEGPRRPPLRYPVRYLLGNDRALLAIDGRRPI